MTTTFLAKREIFLSKLWSFYTGITILQGAQSEKRSFPSSTTFCEPWFYMARMRSWSSLDI